MRSLIKIFLFFQFPLVVLAQEAKQDSLKPKIDYFPTGVRIGTDLIALGRTGFEESFSGWEFNADVDFSRYYFSLDYGRWSRNYPADTVDADSYSNEGSYFRVGADVSFLKKDPDRNMLFFGIRYGRAAFSETFSATINDPVWVNGDYLVKEYQNTGARAGWFELTGGLRVKVWKMLWMGYTARFKFALHTSNTSAMLPHDVPGFGRNDKPSTWGFNYQVFIRLPLPKRK